MATYHRAIGIDLGTTNSVMAVMKAGEPEVVHNKLAQQLTPSAVSFGKRGEMLVGEDALSRPYDPNTIRSIKRFIGLPYAEVHQEIPMVSYQVSPGPGGEVLVHFKGGTYTPIEISAIILYKLRQDAQEVLSERIGRAVITVPAYFNDARVAATRQAGRLAGFTVMGILREPTAAAYAFGLDRTVGRETDNTAANVLVYDLGGGTFDISILMLLQGLFRTLNIGGDMHLGGDDFDQEIMQYLYQKATGSDLFSDSATKNLLKSGSEKAKIRLSSVELAEVVIPAIAGTNIDEEISREQFNEWIDPMLERTVELTLNTLSEKDMSADDIDHVLLVGGSTLVPKVQEMLGKLFGERKLRRNINPMLCVSLGAAIETHLIRNIECPNPECQDDDGRPTSNPLEAEACSRCGTSLVGFETVACSNCFMPNDASQPTCYKCGESLDVDVRKFPQPEPQSWVCQVCKYPKNPLTAEVCEACGNQRIQEGINCPHCEELNPPGQERCVKCDRPLWRKIDVSPENLSVELEDGTLAVMIPKGSQFSTPQPFKRNFRIPKANMRQLEVKVYQGPHDLPAQNEYCGTLLLNLPPDLSQDTLVTILMGLDASGEIFISAHLPDFTDHKATARIERTGGSDPRLLDRQDDLIRQARNVVKWLTNMPEGDQLERKTNALEGKGRQVTAEDLDTFQGELEQYRQIATVIIALEDIKKVQWAARDFMRPEYQTDLERIADDIRRAQSRGHVEQALRSVEELYKEFGGLIEIAILESIRVGGIVNASLANRIGQGLRRLKYAQNQTEVDAGWEELNAVWLQIQREHPELDTRVKPQ